MLFNTSQLQDLTGVKREQLRHWRKVLPPLIGRDGRSDQYSFAEVISVGIVVTLVDDLGLTVSSLINSATELFAFLAEQEETNGLPPIIHLGSQGGISTHAPPDDIYVSVRLEPIVARIQARMAPALKRQLSFDL